jgi:hypothetical protein
MRDLVIFVCGIFYALLILWLGRDVLDAGGL